MGRYRSRSFSRRPSIQRLPGVRCKSIAYAAMVAMMTLCPPLVMFIWYTIAHMDGAVYKSYTFFYSRGLKSLRDVWPYPTVRAWKLIASFAAFEASLLVLLPGERHVGPTSPAGHRPIYKKNGFPAYLATLGVYYVLWKERWFNPAIVYDQIGEIFSVLIIGCYVISIFLYFKGHMAPSSDDWGSSGNILSDFFWGMELYPRISKHFDIKVFTNSRFGVMSWAILVISFAIKQHDTQGRISNSMMVTTSLMLIYTTKFFWGESGFWSSRDVAHDRAGFFVVWGCMVWIPTVYTSPALYMVSHPIQLSRGVALAIFAGGLVCIYIVYDCDRQRQLFHHSNGKCRIWGKVPSKIHAHHVTATGEHKQSLLLTAGWWGIARHFHYVPEIGAAFFWTLPALFKHAIPYFYVSYLAALLVDRAARDDRRCRLKYHKYWEAYCKRVPYKIIPRVF